MAFNPHTEHTFWLCNGEPLSSLGELSEALGKLDSDSFSHHVTSEKNDFACWIRDVFRYGDLANEVSSLDSPQQMKDAVVSFLSRKEIAEQLPTPRPISFLSREEEERMSVQIEQLLVGIRLFFNNKRFDKAQPLITDLHKLYHQLDAAHPQKKRCSEEVARLKKELLLHS